MVRVVLLVVAVLVALSLGGCPETLQVCVPDCAGKECGDDGCDGTCSPGCVDGDTCNASGLCGECAPDCLDVECGGDGCGGSCGTCDTGESCSVLGQCESCDPECTGRVCGDNGCGGSCGDCLPGFFCDTAGQCTDCVPDCTGKTCCDVDDVCGVSCEQAICGTESACWTEGDCSCCHCVIDGLCYSTGDNHPTDACKECHPQGFGGTTAWSADEGTCLIGGECYLDGGTNPDNTCEACQADLHNASWSTLSDGIPCDGGTGVCFQGVCCVVDCGGKACGDDGCGGECPPGCAAGELCTGDGQCQQCIPECVGRNCGFDGCTTDCGRCSAGQVCRAGQCEVGADLDLWVDCNLGPLPCPSAQGTEAEPYCTIRDALMAASAGLTIRIKPGTCLEQVVIGSPLAQVQLLGDLAGGSIIRSSESPVLEIDQQDNVTVADLRIEMGGEIGVKVNSQSAVLERLRVAQTVAGPTSTGDRIGVAVVGSSARLTEINVGPIESDAAGEEVIGVKCESGTAPQIEGCVIHDLRSGPDGNTYGIRAQSVQDGLISGCEIKDLSGQTAGTGNGYSVNGIWLQSCDEWTVQLTDVHHLNPPVCSGSNSCTVNGIGVLDSNLISSYRNRIFSLGPEGVDRISGYRVEGQPGDTVFLRKDLIHDLAGAVSPDGGASAVWVGGAEMEVEAKNLTIARIGLGSPVTTNHAVYCRDDGPLTNRVRLFNSIVSQVEGIGMYADPDAPDEVRGSYVALHACSVADTEYVVCADCLPVPDPMFVDPDNGDFHLRSISPCVDAGEYVDGTECADEPACPLNLGAYGNTPEATGSAWVPMAGGDFTMGADGGEMTERPAHPVNVPAFQMMRTEVTATDYELCQRLFGCYSANPGLYCNYQEPGRELDPINCLSWQEARDFCAWVDPTGRLPSEAEWEWAARSGVAAEPYPWNGSLGDCLEANADNSAGCQNLATWPVCSFLAGLSILGLCDLSGNVAEWVEDEWHQNYNGAPDNGSAWEDAAGEFGADFKVLRGGNYRSGPLEVTVTARVWQSMDIGAAEIGFRCVRDSTVNP